MRAGAQSAPGYGRGRFAHSAAPMPARMPGQLTHNTANPPPPHLGYGTLRGMPGYRQPVRTGTQFQQAPRWPPDAQGNNRLRNSTDVPPQLPNTPPITVEGYNQWSVNRGGVFFANDTRQTSDRHVFLRTGTENSGRKSGQTDPPMDGPARPSLKAVNRTINYQQGSDATRSQDDLTRNFSRNSLGMFVGEQGTGWSPVYGGVPGLYQPYGSYAGVTTGRVKGIQSPVSQGSVGDGPRKVFSGPPHGLHTQTMPDYSQTLGRYMTTAQNRAPRIDRPSNSPIAGQSFSQLVMPQGWTGSTRTTSTAAYGRNRVSVSGWKGRGGTVT